jgi:hypothetical protein
MYIKRPEPNGKIAAGARNGNPDKQIIVSVWEKLPPAIKMNIEQAYAILGHLGKDLEQGKHQ